MFEAALSLLPALPPEEVIALLEIRIGLLEKTIEEIDEEERICREMKLPRLFSLESEYYEAITLAEYEFSKDLLADLKRDAGDCGAAGRKCANSFWRPKRPTAKNKRLFLDSQ